MKQPIFTGACSAVVTPFDKTGAVDYPVFGRLIDSLIEQGLDAICVCGTTGECASLSVREHISAVEFCVRHTDHRVKVIAGSGSNNTATAVYFTRKAEDAGADAVLHVTPYYNKTSQAGLIRHYEFIADRTGIPVIMYNVPSRTGVSFTPDTYKVLSQHPMINGVKEASSDLSLLASTRAMCGDDLFIWSGCDELTVPMMSLGALGSVSVAANIIPGAIVALTHACLDHDFVRAAQLQLFYADFFSALFSDVNPIPIKTALQWVGRSAGGLRLPLCEMSPGPAETLRLAMERIGLLARQQSQ